MQANKRRCNYLASLLKQQLLEKTMSHLNSNINKYQNNQNRNKLLVQFISYKEHPTILELYCVVDAALNVVSSLLF